MALPIARHARLAAVTILALVALIPVARLVVPVSAAPPQPPPARIAYRPLPPASTAVTLHGAVAPMPAAPPPPLVIRHVIDTRGPLRFGAYFWDDGAVPAGPLTITVDLKASVLSVFRGGYEIGTTAVIYGADAKQTPLGTFPILQKDRHHFSSTYNHAPMPYTLRLTGDGISIHASEVAAEYATHGCIGVPAGFARKLFAVASVGDRVIVTNRGAPGQTA